MPENKKSDDPSRHVVNGLGILDNNEVNVLMALLMSVGGIFIASYIWHIPSQSILG